MILNGEYVSRLTDEELCMLEQLTYLDEIVAEKAGVNDVFSKVNTDDFKGQKICEVLSVFDEKAITRLMAYPESICDGDISGVEWAKIISYLKDENHRISHLVLCEEMENGWNNHYSEYGEEGGKGYYRAAVFNPYICDNEEINSKYSGKYIDIGIFYKYFAKAALDATGEHDIARVLDKMLWATEDEIGTVGKMVRIPLALAFTDHLGNDNSDNEVIIVYRGTTGPNEYSDDIRTTYESDTTAQKGGLDFVNQIKYRYGDITVVGHSKGGNKAMYATINCDDVVRCVCFDAQGFSKEFIDSYRDKINERAHLITNYSVETDYVHEILNQLPGAKQIFIKGYGIDKISENHASNSFFKQDNADFYELATYSGSDLYETFLHFLTDMETYSDDAVDRFINRIKAAEMLYNLSHQENITFKEYCDYNHETKKLDVIDENNKKIIAHCMDKLFHFNNSDNADKLSEFEEYIIGISSDNFKAFLKHNNITALDYVNKIDVYKEEFTEGQYLFNYYDGIAFRAKVADWLYNRCIECMAPTDEMKQYNGMNDLDDLSNWCSAKITNPKVDCIHTYERDYIADIFEVMYNMYGEEFYNYLKRYMRFNSDDGGNNPEFEYAEKENKEITKLKGLTDYLVNASKNDETLRGFLEYMLKEGMVDENADGTLKMSTLDYLFSLAPEEIVKELSDNLQFDVNVLDAENAMEIVKKNRIYPSVINTSKAAAEDIEEIKELYKKSDEPGVKAEVVALGIFKLIDTVGDVKDFIEVKNDEKKTSELLLDMVAESVVSPVIADILGNHIDELADLIAHVVFYSKSHGLGVTDAKKLVSRLMPHSLFNLDTIATIATYAVFSGIAIAVDVEFLGATFTKEFVKEALEKFIELKILSDEKFFSIVKDTFDDSIIRDMAVFVNQNSFIDKRLSFYKNNNAMHQSNDEIVSKLLTDIRNYSTISKFKELNNLKNSMIDILAENGYHLILGSKYDEFLSYDHNIAREIYFGDSDAARQINDNDDKKVVILGGPGNDTIYFNGKNVRDEIKLSQIWGGSGDDNIILGDNISGENAVVHGDSGIEDIGGSDTINGSLGDDRIYGDGGYDFLYGRRGDDKLYGNDGNDILSGGRGRDELYGGTGNDTYIYERFDEDSQLITSNNNDFIKDSQGNNIVHFPDLDINDLSIDWWDKSKHDLKITVKSLGTSLTIRDFYKTSGNFTFTFGKSSEKYYVSQKTEGKFEFKIISSVGYSGGISGNSIYSPLVGCWYDKKSLLAYEEYKKASEAQQTRDPLIINFSSAEENNGLVGVENGVYFDLDNNGIAEKTAWIDSNKGFLALDRNGDGKITNGGELFGDQVTLKNGKFSTSGFEALAELDDNIDEETGVVGDGVIDKNDSMFDQLRVWIDKTRNGISETGELKTLSELGIASISLNTSNKAFVDAETKTSITETADVRLTNGKTLNISEHWFEVHTFDTQQVSNNGETVDSPFVFGNLPNIEDFVNSEENSEIKELYESFVASNDYIEKRILTRKILYTLSGADKIAVNSRGVNIDARELRVIETIMGVDSYIGTDGADPNVNATHILDDMYNEFEEYYFNLLNSGTESYSYVDLIDEITDEDGNNILDTSLLDEAFEDTYVSDAKKCEIISGICSYLKLYDENNGTGYLDVFKTKYSDYANDYERMSDINIVFGTESNDVFEGTDKNDIFDSRAGNDKLYGGFGDDTFIYGKGYGNDIIWDNNGKNKIKFVGLNPSDLYVSYPKGSLNAVLTIAETGETLTLDHFLYSEYFQQFTLEFDNGIEMALNAEESPFLNVHGTEDADEFNSVFNNEKMYGLSGNDILRGNGKNVFMYGGDDDDQLFGERGNDVLDGGTGNDKLYGGFGDDTFIYGKGYGNDIIWDNNGMNKIKFVGLNPSDLYVSYPKGSLNAVLTIAETGETLTLDHFLYSEYFQQFTLEFDNGTVAHIDHNTATIVVDSEGITVAIEQTNAEYLSGLYTEDVLGEELATDNIVDTDSVSIAGESGEIADMTDIQAMVLAENMSAFSNDSKIYDGINIGDITADTSALDQLLADTSMK